MYKNYIVKKSNYFIMNSSYDLSLEEQKIILTLSSMVQPHDEEFKLYKFKINEFIELLGIKNQAKYSEIPKITKNLMKKVFEIKHDEKIIQIAWLSSATYEKGSGFVELEFSPKLKPYMLQLKELFTQYKLNNILSMKSKYSPRIYEILKCNQFKQQSFININLNDLRQLLKVQDSYKRFYDLKKHVIEMAQKELKDLTDISFKFEEVHLGRKVISINFYIYSNKEINNKNELPIQKNEEKEDIEYIKNILKEENINLTQATQLYKNANKNIKHIIEVYEYSKTQNISNFLGFMTEMVKPGRMNQPVTHSKSLKFNNFDQRTYNYNELERKLLGWDVE